MSNTKEVLKESSAIIAGFKLAVIVLSYIGLGSVANWFVENWYPVTRHFWDLFFGFFGLPEIPVVVKDSLTALLFFLPLGLTAVYQLFFPPDSRPTIAFRTVAGFLGLLLFLLVTKDVISAIYKTLGLDTSSLKDSPLIRVVFLLLIGITTLVGTKLLSDKVEKYLIKITKMLLPDLNYKQHIAILFGFLLIGAGFILFGINELYSKLNAADIDFGNEVNVAIVLLIATVLLIWFAVIYAPRKLYVATGASFAFILAALVFEIILRCKLYIESIN